jgi:hypothetical protein
LSVAGRNGRSDAFSETPFGSPSHLNRVSGGFREARCMNYNASAEYKIEQRRWSKSIVRPILHSMRDHRDNRSDSFDAAWRSDRERNGWHSSRTSDSERGFQTPSCSHGSRTHDHPRGRDLFQTVRHSGSKWTDLPPSELKEKSCSCQSMRSFVHRLRNAGSDIDFEVRRVDRSARQPHRRPAGRSAVFERPPHHTVFPSR